MGGWLRGEHAVNETTFDVSRALRVLLGTLAGAAAVIHLVMAPSHADESAIEGAGFLIAGWVQAVLAVLLLTSASRLVLKATIVVNVALIGAWAVSRVWGLPVGAHAGHAESVTAVDLTCVAVEAALVVACGVALFRPGLMRGWQQPRFLVGATVPAAVVVLVSGVLISPSARDHANASHGDHGSEEHAAAGHEHDDADDNGLSQLENGHQHDSGWEDLDDATQTELAAQLNQTRALIDKYPTIAAAEAAGYRRAGPFSPGLGTHYINFGGYGGDNADALQVGDQTLTPTLIYDGLEPNSPIAGFMYMALGSGEPEGFAGPNDHWHYHTHTCVVFEDGTIEAPFGADDPGVTEEMCSEVGGSLIENTGYMLHVWTVPGYESPRGVFSEINPGLPCPDGTYYTKASRELGFATTACRD
jgi:hypothetical protein